MGVPMKFTTLIPLTRNDGSKVSRKELAEIEATFWMRFGGMTRDGVTIGNWISPTTGRHHVHECLKVFVVCENSRLAEAQEFVRRIGERLGEEEMYFEVQYYDGPQFLKV